jgi:LemA protein
MLPLVAGLAAALVLALTLVAVVAFTTYNTVVALQRRADRAWANVDVALEQRHDELPNVVAAVRGQLGFERTVLDEVTRLRASYSPTAPLPKQAATSDATSSALRSLFAVVEHYPELHSDQNVMALQGEIERLETLIAHRRELFNQQVYQYNATIQQFPGALFARLFDWRPRELFEVTPADRARPDVGIAPA